MQQNKKGLHFCSFFFSSSCVVWFSRSKVKSAEIDPTENGVQLVQCGAAGAARRAPGRFGHSNLFYNVPLSAHCKLYFHALLVCLHCLLTKQLCGQFAILFDVVKPTGYTAHAFGNDDGAYSSQVKSCIACLPNFVLTISSCTSRLLFARSRFFAHHSLPHPGTAHAVLVSPL